MDMWRCHEEYGDFVRYAPNGLLVNTAKGLHGMLLSVCIIKMAF